MTRRLTRRTLPNEVLQVVLDDATVERLRYAADRLGIEVETLLVQVIHRASWNLDEVLPDATSSP